MPTPAYQGNPDALADVEFEPGALHHLVPGNRGRLLDSRRTPVVVRGVRIEHGMFELEVAAFEDTGARWLLPFEDIARFQFARGAEIAKPDAVIAYERSVRRLDRPLTIATDRSVRRATLRAVAAERERVAAWLDRRLPARVPDLAGLVERGEGIGHVQPRAGRGPLRRWSDNHVGGPVPAGGSRRAGTHDLRRDPRHEPPVQGGRGRSARRGETGSLLIANDLRPATRGSFRAAARARCCPARHGR
jgi:hypothetical protein